jgi:urease accessory protein
MMVAFRAPLCLLALLLASPTHAHPGHAIEMTAIAGVMHPWLGLDHALAAVAVGIWASAQSGRRRWIAPLLFVSVMALGAWAAHAVGMSGSAEAGVAGSVALLGCLILSVEAMPASLALTAIATFAIAHGLAHGGEAPPTGSWPLYLAGLAAGTILLHAVGLAVGTLMRRHGPRLWPIAGFAFAAAGTWLLAG